MKMKITEQHPLSLHTKGPADYSAGRLSFMAIAASLIGLATPEVLLATPTSTQTIKIEVGGDSAYQANDGGVFAADIGFDGGIPVDNGAVDISGTSDSRIYQTRRVGMKGYAVPVSNGSYLVRLHFAELLDAVTGPGQRVFGLSVEGSNLPNVDIFQEAGGARTALIREVEASVTDGELTIAFTEMTRKPVLNALEIIPKDQASSAPSPTPTALPAPTASSDQPPAPPTSNGPPKANGPKFLSRKGVGDDQEAFRYYQAIGAIPRKGTLQRFRRANRFDRGGEVVAHFYNSADLNLGREMHCKAQPGNGLACYVTNYGTPGFPEKNVVRNVLSQTFAHKNPAATVAMEYVPAPAGTTEKRDEVRFYIYDGQGKLIPSLALDGEGNKAAPQMCQSCHGGSYDSQGHSVIGASFLPFNLFLYKLQSRVFGPESVQETFRKLNLLVLRTNPNPTNPNEPVQKMLDMLYPTGLSSVGSRAKNSTVLPSWNGDELTVDFFQKVAKPYCLTCHVAQPSYVDFTSPDQIRALAPIAQGSFCNNADMPHAEVPAGKLSEDLEAKELIKSFFGIVDPCDPLD